MTDRIIPASLSTRLGKTLLVLLLCLACIPVQGLIFAQQAWADEAPAAYAVYYTKKGQTGYTLVIQASNAAQSKYGTKYQSAPIKSSFGFYDQPVSGITNLGIPALNNQVVSVNSDATLSKPITSMYRWFQGMSNCKEISLNFDASAVTDMSDMFNSCISLTKVNFGKGFKTSSLKDAHSMFYGCLSLASIDLSQFDFSNTENLASLFLDCPSLQTAIIPQKNFSKVTSTLMMFSGCKKLQRADFEQVDFSSLKTLESMFDRCESLKSVNFSGVKCPLAQNTSALFIGCNSLKNISLPTLPKVKDISYMFCGCSALEQLDLSQLGFNGSYRTISSFMSESQKAQAKENNKRCNGAFAGCSYLSRVVLPSANSSGLGSMLEQAEAGCFVPNNTGKWVHESGIVFDYIPANVGGVYTLQISQTAAANTNSSVGSTQQKPYYYTDLVMATIKVGKSYWYTGKKIKPKVTVIMNGKTLRKGTDYTLKYEYNKLPGEAWVWVYGKGKYEGDNLGTFKIKLKRPSINKVVSKKKGLKVYWSRVSGKFSSGYEIRYSTKKSMKNSAKVVIKGSKKTSAKINKLKGGKKYYVQVRGYKKIGWLTYYSAWSKAKAVKTKK